MGSGHPTKKMQRGLTHLLNREARKASASQVARGLTKSEIMKFTLIGRCLERMPRGVSKRISLALAELYG